MAFPDLDLPTTVNTSSHDIIEDFFVPVLRNAVRYDRGVGYFSSGWLRANAQGMVAFAENGGCARWITSPILSESDWKSLAQGEKARHDDVLREALQQNIDDLATSLTEDTLSAMAWMIADGVLDFRLALPHSKLNQGEFHDKFGIFEDTEGHRIGFNGSYNDSQQGLRNYESLKIFCSWKETASFVEDDAQRFERLWKNEDPFVHCYMLPQAAEQQILKLRASERPYTLPDNFTYTQTSVSAASSTVEEPSTIELWEHQQEALDAWEANNNVGLLNMATGSGKTITALVAAERQKDLQLLVIAVPTKNLVEQWDEELRAVTALPNPLLIYENSARWQDRLFRKMRSMHRQNWPHPIVAIGSMDSMSGDRFQSVLEDAKIPDRSMLIVDEVHNVGAPTYQRILDSHYTVRLGLSATPERAHDEEGSQAIMDFFGREVYTYSLKEALDDERLTPYDYHIYAAPLSPGEYDKYLKLTRAILAQRNSSDEGATLYTNSKLDGDGESVEQLLFRRARILKKANSKVDLIQDILADHAIERGLIYCADTDQLEKVQSVLTDLGLVHLKYIGDTSPEKRRAALKALERGDVPAIVAIDCLDEGVDVPVVDTAVILASSTNKRQFIQRRGRVLRTAPGKDKATLIDMVTLPPSSVGQDGRWLLRGELRRAKIIAELADNRDEALLQLKKHTESYGVMLTELLSEDHG